MSNPSQEEFNGFKSDVEARLQSLDGSIGDVRKQVSADLDHLHKELDRRFEDVMTWLGEMMSNAASVPEDRATQEPSHTNQPPDQSMQGASGVDRENDDRTEEEVKTGEWFKS